LATSNDFKIRPKYIYLEIEQFKELCNANLLSISDKLLELYEKHDLLYPIYRIFRPKDYLQLIYKQRYNYEQPYNNEFEIPDQYEKLAKFEYKDLDRWNSHIFQDFEIALDLGHPLDQAYHRGEEFIIKPSKQTFKDWDEYKVNLHALFDNRIIENVISRARHFYTSWQIYILEEINSNYFYETNRLIEVKNRNDFYWKDLPFSKILLNDWREFFNVLGQYRFKVQLLFEKSMEGIKTGILEGEPLHEYHIKERELAKIYISNHNYESWVNFLKVLCGRYFNYLDKEKIKLSQNIKSEIYSVIDLILFSSNKQYRDILNDVGRHIDGRTFLDMLALEHIYPEYDSHLKRKTSFLLSSSLKKFNENVPEFLKLTENDVEEIMDYALKIGNETIMVSLIQLNKEYFEPSHFGREALFSYIRSLSNAIESWCIILVGRERIVYKKALDILTDNKFSMCCNKLQNKCEKNNLRVNSCNELKIFLNALHEIDMEIEGERHSWIKLLIRSYLIRNYLAHHTRIDPQLMGTTFIEIYNSLTFTIFYAWGKRTSKEIS
jgi:hypothetical protein